MRNKRIDLFYKVFDSLQYDSSHHLITDNEKSPHIIMCCQDEENSRPIGLVNDPQAKQINAANQ